MREKEIRVTLGTNAVTDRSLSHCLDILRNHSNIEHPDNVTRTSTASLDNACTDMEGSQPSPVTPMDLAHKTLSISRAWRYVSRGQRRQEIMHGFTLGICLAL